MKARGLGDEGLAVDLQGLADVDLEPRVDSGRLAALLVAAERADDATKRAALLEDARRLAGSSSSALALIQMTVDRLSSAA